MNVERMEPRTCPGCGVQLARAVCIDGTSIPNVDAGELAICGHCGQMIEFVRDGVVPLSEDKMRAMAKENAPLWNSLQAELSNLRLRNAGLPLPGRQHVAPAGELKEVPEGWLWKLGNGETGVAASPEDAVAEMVARLESTKPPAPKRF